MGLDIGQASTEDVDAVRGILLEAAGWLRDSGMELWWEHELAGDHRAGPFHVARYELVVGDGASR